MLTTVNEPIPNPLQSQPDFAIPPDLEAEIDELITHYPVRRSASMMVLHAIQERFGWLSQEAIEWTARKLELQPINIYELVTFYPMFRQHPMGRYQIKVCRTLSCALRGAHGLYRHFCEKLGLDPSKHGPQTTKDGRFSIEFVECLAACGTAPVLMVNDDLHENVTAEKADQILEDCR
ncbi:MAG TPA: NAD(P)H-dependent oxidoreductase subunit E [Verrucomicrobia bacterium]|nr:NAD(P)H-dependent oxidoreductase subunit E [Verrucomicrobiota bacterium]HOP98321.1 NAD(P)H-dependent oxidoreductase subunit E [Verrucomicrobiota bacterium]HPU55518.1 NAD(P)H-dependent oxidoreductase subunit E [Verrucomicrobiota bacterium]